MIIHFTAHIICLITFRFFILFIIRFNAINLHQHAYVHSLIDNNFIFFPQNSIMQINQPTFVSTGPEVSWCEVPEECFLRLHS